MCSTISVNTLGKQNSRWPVLILFFGLILAGLGAGAADAEPFGTAGFLTGDGSATALASGSTKADETTLGAQQVPTPKPRAPEVGKPSTDPPRVSSKQWVWLQIALGAAVVGCLWFGNVIKPSSLGQSGGKGGGKGGDGAGGSDRPWWAFLFAAVVIYLAMGVGAEAINSQIRLNASWLGGVTAGSTKGNSIAMLGQGFAGLIAGFAMLALASGGLKRPTWKDLGIGLLAIVVALPVVNATGLVALEIYRAFKESSPPTIGHNTLQTISDSRSDPWAWTQAAAAILITPIVEELIYRYFLQSALVRAFKRAWLGVLVTAALFAAAHIGAVPSETLSTVLPVLFVLGLALGIAMQRTGKLSVPIVMHAMFNAVNVAMTIWLNK
ncbi:MAG: CPBP family intramembrane metalloprotease [Phycisphaeraceae bacterium]|nr:CPBP family intramembrane metalloprotease [Phycisphaeraceae bacterium]